MDIQETNFELFSHIILKTPEIDFTFNCRFTRFYTLFFILIFYNIVVL